MSEGQAALCPLLSPPPPAALWTCTGGPPDMHCRLCAWGAEAEVWLQSSVSECSFFLAWRTASPTASLSVQPEEG